MSYLMSILQGLFRKTNNNVQLANVPTSNGASSDIDSIRNEISTLKRYVTVTNSRQRVSKKQRDVLMAKVMNALNKAEGALIRASGE